MGHTCIAVIGTEEIRLPLDQVDAFRRAALAATQGEAAWVPIRISPSRTIEVLIGPYTTARIETIDVDETDEDGEAWP